MTERSRRGRIDIEFAALSKELRLHWYSIERHKSSSVPQLLAIAAQSNYCRISRSQKHKTRFGPKTISSFPVSWTNTSSSEKTRKWPGARCSPIAFGKFSLAFLAFFAFFSFFSVFVLFGRFCGDLAVPVSVGAPDTRGCG